MFLFNADSLRLENANDNKQSSVSIPYKRKINAYVKYPHYVYVHKQDVKQSTGAHDTISYY